MRHYLNAYAFRIAQLGLGFFAASWSARLLGLDGRGQFATAQTVIALTVYVGSLGIPSGVTHFAARNPERLPQLLGSTLAATVALAGLSCAVLSTLPNADFGPVNPLIYLGVSAQMLFYLLTLALTGIGEVLLASRLETYMRVLWLGALFLWVQLHTPDLFVLLGLQQGSYLVGVAALLVYLARRGLAWDGALLGQVTQFSLRSYASGLAGTLWLSQNILILRYLRGSEEVGLFCSAALFSNLLYQSPQALYPVVLREMSVLHDLPSRWRRARKMILAVMALSGLAALAMTALGPFLLRLVFGKPFVAAAPAMPWLLLGSTLFVGYHLSLPVVVASGQPWGPVLAQVVIVGLDALLNWLWIPHRGFVGAAQVMALTSALWLLTNPAYIVWELWREKLARASKSD